MRKWKTLNRNYSVSVVALNKTNINRGRFMLQFVQVTVFFKLLSKLHWRRLPIWSNSTSFILISGVGLWVLRPHWPIVPAPGNSGGDCGEISGMKIGRGKYSEKTCPSATLSTTNTTWLDPSLNPGRRGGKPATKRLSYGAAILLVYFIDRLFILNADGQIQ
jgi:hypothetical protein